MFHVLFILCCVFLFAVSLLMLSKSAEQRARSRTELFYAQQIREEADAIRLQNEKSELEISNVKRWEKIADINGNEIPSEDSSVDVGIPQEIAKPAIQEVELQEVELKELELDEKALEFVSKFQPKQDELEFQNVTIYEEPTAWFNFPEVDLHMNERPEKGLFYVAAKIMDILDETTAIISDGTGERMLYHHKVEDLSVGDIIISQVDVLNGVWNFLHVWEINDESIYAEKEAM